jgi:hypothetical protein
MIQAQDKKLRLKKSSDGKIFGPLTALELRDWAESALIAPDDLVDFNDDAWVHAYEVEDLGMIWKIEAVSGESYGPTTMGTVREFYVSGELVLDDKVVNTKTGETKTVRDLMGPDVKKASDVEPLGAEDGVALEDTAELPAPSTPMPPGAVKGEDMAKDLRIRQLESDLKTLQQEYEHLTHEFRKLTEQLAALKKQKAG